MKRFRGMRILHKGFLEVSHATLSELLQFYNWIQPPPSNNLEFQSLIQNERYDMSNFISCSKMEWCDRFNRVP